MAPTVISSGDGARGDGYNFHVTGLTHDERGYPT